MRIVSITHRGLKRLVLEDQSKGVPPASVKKLRTMIAVLEDVTSLDALRTLPLWNAHQLKGDRAGTWALHVTRNLRLTFRINNNEICEVNLEDYH